MCSKRDNRFRSTVTFRLTLIFVVLFALLLGAVLIPIDVTLHSIMIHQLDTKIATHLGNFSYYGGLFDRKSRDEAIGIITDNLAWTASIGNEHQVLWLMLSDTREVITSSNTQPWQASLATIIGAVPDLPYYGELSPEVRPETLNHRGLRFVEVEGVKQLAAFKTLRIPGKPGQFRAAFMKYHNGMVMVGIYGLNDIDNQMARYRKVQVTAFAFVLLVGGGLGFFTTKGAMVGVQRVTQTARAIGQGDLSRRVTLKHPGREIEDLAQAFNEMLGRIQVLIKELKEVTTNIAHDLRSPVTRIRGAAEGVLHGQNDLEACREANGKIVAECDRLIGIVNTMLEMAAMDAGTTERPETPVDVTAIVQGACDLFQPLADDKAIALHWNHNGTPATVRGSKQNLQRVVSNIIDNAIKFTPEGGRVEVDVTHTETEVSVRVQDTGAGISRENQSRIFDRFFRADSSRATDGNGLGLSLAQSIVKAHGGRIQVESEEGQGSRFTVVLPAA